VYAYTSALVHECMNALVYECMHTEGVSVQILGEHALLASNMPQDELYCG